MKKTSAGKTVAWINYMTNVNKVYGNFAAGMPEEFMVLNRNYTPKIDSVINGRVYNFNGISVKLPPVS